jgi:hypothetical protein
MGGAFAWLVDAETLLISVAPSFLVNIFPALPDGRLRKSCHKVSS